MYVRFFVFQSLTNVYFNGAPYVSGGATSVQGDCGISYPIAAGGIPSGYLFYQWQSDYGAFGSLFSPSSSFYPSSGHDNAVVLILNQTGHGNWAGFEASGAGFAIVSGTFSLNAYAPTFTTGSSSHPNVDIVPAWVGIGGDTSWDNLFQAGVMVNASRDNTWLITPWVEWVYGHPPLQPPSCCLPVFDNRFHAGPGDVIQVVVSYYSSNQSDYWSVKDLTKGWESKGWHLNFVPATTTADWIAEWVSGYAMPTFHDPNPAQTPTAFMFTQMATNVYPSWSAPLSGHDARDFLWCSSGTQNLWPNYITVSQSTGMSFPILAANAGTC